MRGQVDAQRVRLFSPRRYLFIPIKATWTNLRQPEYKSTSWYLLRGRKADALGRELTLPAR